MRRHRSGALVLSTVLAATLLAATPSAWAATVQPKKAQEVKSVAGGAIPVKPLTASTAQEFKAPTVTWPAAGTAEVSMAQARTSAVQAGNLPVRVQGADAGSVKVEVLSQDESAKAGVQGVMVRLSRPAALKAAAPLALSVDYNGFRYAYGGDWASRLRFVPLNGAPATGSVRNDFNNGVLTAEVPAGATAATYAVAAAAEGATGDYKATSLSASDEWQVSQQSGAFSWSYPLRVPPVAGDLVPQLKAAYDSGSVDGRVATSNNQTSSLGEGWDMSSSGFIERGYKACAEDPGNQGSTKTGDLCWATDNATLSMEGHSGPLVYDPVGRFWHLKNDDGSRIEHLWDTDGTDNGDDNREYWRLTTPDGTQYNFGLNKIPDGRPDSNSVWTVPVAGNGDGEPCNKSTYDASFCKQAYRWNLDYVKDRHGNTMSYTYEQETNKYGRNLGKTVDTYTRGGNLLRIEYGTRAGVAGEAPAKVEFTLSDRCLNGPACTTKTPANWPDVPWDRDCPGTTCGDKWAPTFWSTKRLTAITTYIKGASEGVERWSFDHSYPTPGDNTSPALWLKGIGHTGLVGDDITLPAVTFVEDPIEKGNRVDGTQDGFPPTNKNRIMTINNGSGGQISVKYKETNCTAGSPPKKDDNPLRCFPVRWAMDGGEPTDDWFHKRVVESVALIDRVGGAPTQFTSYDYDGNAAWAYRDDPLVDQKYRTWSDWRGYAKVTVRKGDPKNPGNKIESATTYRYFRGMNGDKLAGGGTKPPVKVDGIDDDPQLSGFLREQIANDGAGGAEVAGTVNKPWFKQTAAFGNLKSHIVKIGDTYDRSALEGGAFRRVETHTTFDDIGQPLTVNDLGDMADPNDDQCATNTYVKNVGAWILSLPRTVTKVGVACGATPTYPQDAISDVQSYYDNLPLGQVDKGNVTTLKELAKHNGTPEYVMTKRAEYDDYGRETKTIDAMDRESTTVYTPDTGFATTVTNTNALGHVTTTKLNPAYGSTESVEDPNKNRSDTTYDSLGRLVAVWTPGRNKASGQGATVRFGYKIRDDGASWVTTEKLKPNSNYVTTIQLYDGFMRDRQTQAPSPQGGRVLTDKLYDTRGLLAATNASYYNLSAPDKNLFGPEENQIPNRTVVTYDGAERKTKETYEKLNLPQWATTTAYSGDHITVTPPQGGIPTATYTNARGLTTEVQQFADGGVTTTKRSYTKAGELAKITDAVNNVWTNEYDVAGKRIKTVDPDKGEATTTYNANGEVVTTKDARGQVTWRKYDKLGRQTELRKDSETGDLLASWTYDTVKGQLSSTTRYVGTKKYVNSTTTYDAAYRPVDVAVTVPDDEGDLKGTFNTHTEYLADGSIASIVLPKLSNEMLSETLVYTYDSLGMPKTLKANGTQIVSAATYTALGELTQLQQGPDGKRAWQTSYYEEGTRRLSDTLVERETNTDVQTDQAVYSYDPIGNVKKIETKTAGAVLDRQCMAYDGMRRLREAWTSTSDCAAPGAAIGGPAPYWNSYQPDAIGRRTSQTQHGINGVADTVTTTTYPAAGQPQPHAPETVSVSGPARRTAAAPGEFDYDSAGNTVSKPSASGAQTYTWDLEGQLSSVTNAGVKTEFVNTPDNTRLLAKQPNAATLYLPSGEVKLDNATKKLTGTRYYMFGGAVVAAKTGSSLSYVTPDHQGTGTLSVNADSLVFSKRRFDPFGVARGTTAAWPTAQGFVGGKADPATGLTRLGVRDYDPALGKFISVDPLLNDESPQHLDAYTYSRNNPTTFSDPSGEMDWEEQKSMLALKLDSQGRREDANRVRQQIDARRNAPVTNGGREQAIPVGKRGTTNAQRARAKYEHEMSEFRKKQAIARERARTAAREINKLAGRHVVQEDGDYSSIWTGIGSGSVCMSGTAGSTPIAVAREECINFDEVGITYSNQYKAGFQVGAGFAADMISRVNAEKADQIASGVTLSAEAGIKVHMGPGVDFSHEWEVNSDEEWSDSAQGGAGFGAQLSIASGWVNAGYNSGYVIRWDGNYPVKPRPDGPTAKCHPTLC
ncbi:RHS repeat-associated protein [Kibdelosporangium banguiense]|uniref:RHS repeat-associated protein n=1 Tax=Kibdelosporangium banguiense TaxID=1365924 RepID=A0ABS4T9S4_9PSEU|nr:RHS repeat-associated core domain-containing protein [Kibdelosporangium banguiense]MBP2321180.1 RHS repeat-associated protein [Kibdelosporangium banguiense]